MTLESIRKTGIFVLMAFGVVTGAIIANAPDGFLFLWELKAAAVSFTGVAGLLLNPLPTPKSKPE